MQKENNIDHHIYLLCIQCTKIMFWLSSLSSVFLKHFNSYSNVLINKNCYCYLDKRIINSSIKSSFRKLNSLTQKY